MNITLKDLTTKELFDQIKPMGGSVYLARKIQSAALLRNEWLKRGPEISERVLTRVRESVTLPQLKLLQRIESPKDGFVRYVFKGEDKGSFEAVRIPLLHRHKDRKYIVCVSSIVSLTSANPATRRKLMPVEIQWPTGILMESLREYHKKTRERITLAWILISGVNTGVVDARELAMITKGLPVKIDLIDVNDPKGKFIPPASGELNSFRDALRKELAMPVSRRYSGGADINAGCGMLSSRL